MKAPMYLHLCKPPEWSLYVGMTTDLGRRVYEHRTRAVPGFTQQYGVERLAYIEFHDTTPMRALPEKQLKRWRLEALSH